MPGALFQEAFQVILIVADIWEPLKYLVIYGVYTISKSREHSCIVSVGIPDHWILQIYLPQFFFLFHIKWKLWLAIFAPVSTFTIEYLPCRCCVLFSYTLWELICIQQIQFGYPPASILFNRLYFFRAALGLQKIWAGSTESSPLPSFWPPPHFLCC